MKTFLILAAMILYLTLLTIWSFSGPPWAFQRTAPYSMVTDTK